MLDFFFYVRIATHDYQIFYFQIIPGNQEKIRFLDAIENSAYKKEIEKDVPECELRFFLDFFCLCFPFSSLELQMLGKKGPALVFKGGLR